MKQMSIVRNADSPVETLSELCLFAASKYSKKAAFSMCSEGKIVRKITYAQVGKNALRIASILRQLGVEKGDKVLLLSDNCPEWPLAYFGIALAGAVSVPLLTGFSIEQIEHITKHSGAKAVCISAAMAEKFKINLPFICIDNISTDNISHSDDITEETYEKRHPEDLATIIYTSGTQGNSKGVMLSNKNLLSCVLSSYSYFPLKSSDAFLSVLPLAHSYECSIGFLFPVIGGAEITYIDRPPSPSVMLPALKVVRPTIMLTVPLLIEKIYNNAIAPKLNKKILLKFPVMRNLAVLIAGLKLKKTFGGRLRFYGIGGAPLSEHVLEFLTSAKFPYALGYGLTETAPFLAGNSPFYNYRGGGIWPPENVKLRIEKNPELKNDEGEIQVQGPNVMLGYYDDEEKTSEVFTKDGWFRTGDLGNFDSEGRLFIRGRLKAMILGPSGENIYPEEIEGLLGASSLVEESLVYSGKKGEIVALVRLSEAAKMAAGVIEKSLEDLRAYVNTKLSGFSRISKIVIKPDPFEKTPTMKIKRYLYV